MFEDAMTYPEHIIKGYQARIKELEEENKKLKDAIAKTSWNETRPMFDSYGQYIGERSG